MTGMVRGVHIEAAGAESGIWRVLDRRDVEVLFVAKQDAGVDAVCRRGIRTLRLRM